MARLGSLILTSWILVLFLILSAKVYKMDTVTSQPDAEDSFVEDVRDISYLLRMFISLIEAVNIRIGRALKLQPETTTSVKDLETDSIEELFNRFETACRSFRDRFLKYMETRGVMNQNPKSKSSRDPDVSERLSYFERSVMDTYLDGLDAGQQYSESNESTTDTENINVEHESSGEVAMDEIEYSPAVSLMDHNEGDIDDTTNSWAKEIESSSLDSVDIWDERFTEKDESSAMFVTEEIGSGEDFSTGILTEVTEENESSSESTDDDEVTIEDDDSATTELLSETELVKVTESVSRKTTDEDSSLGLDNLELSSNIDSMSNSKSSKIEKAEHDFVDSYSQFMHSSETKPRNFVYRPSFKESHRRPLLVSVIGAPGKHFPNYSLMPETSFTCEDKKYIPGAYADMETKCQVFHVCWPHKIESFLCPIGTTFNQQCLSCDYWFSSTCSLSPNHFDLNKDLFENLKPANSDSEDGSALALELEKQNSPTRFLIKKMRFVPIQFEMSSFPKKRIHDEHPLLNELENSFEKKGKDSNFSKLELEFARKLYSELFKSPSDFGFEDKHYTSTLDSLFHKMKLQARKGDYEDFLTKSDRSGLVAETVEKNSDQESLEMAESETEKPNIVSKRPKLKLNYPHSDLAKEHIAPLIVFKALETAENVLNQGILPLTREMLAASYSKLPKRKKL